MGNKAEKPKILILMHYMELGGAEISLIGLLNAMDPNKVDVDLFIYSHQGPLMKLIPSCVNLLPEQKSYLMIEKPLREVIKKRYFKIALARLKAKQAHKNYRKSVTQLTGEDNSIFQFIGNAVTPVLPEINPHTEYDLCISFLTPHNIGKDKVNAKKRLAWIHTDYSTVHVNAELELPVWNAYDYIASISPNVTQSFLKTFPTLSDKIVEIENILSPFLVHTRAKEFDAREELIGEMKLLSIGRYCYQKNFDNIPDIMNKIISYGIEDIKWYIIGFGGDEALIRQKVKESGMENHVILLGKKNNPYPYIKACDIYVQPSRYEGKSVTVREAQMLCKPVVITNYPTAESQVRDGNDGIIVPMDNDGCAQGIADLIKNQELQRQLCDNCEKEDFGNENEVQKIYRILGI